MKKLELKDIFAKVDQKEILRGISLSLEQGEVHVLLGPNGAGKSTISNIIMGHPKYSITSGDLVLGEEKLNDVDPSQRAKKGLFMSFQQPSEISGVTMVNFLKTAYNSLHEKELKTHEFHKLLKEKMSFLEMDPKFRTRFVNEGFSGGEKKRSEILQLLLFEPDFAILDEIDSGLDVDALKLVAKGIQKVQEVKKMGILLITHHDKLLEYVKPDKVHIIKEGKIVRSGGIELVKEVHEKGFE